MIRCCSTAIFHLLWSSATFAASVNTYHLEVPKDNLCEFGPGWANYCDTRLIVEEKKSEPVEQPVTIIQVTPKAPEKDPNDPLVWLENYQTSEKRARALMLMEPSQENVDAWRKDYFEDTMDRSTLVSDYWRRSAWQNPENDYTLRRPTGYLSKRQHDRLREDRVNETVESLNERYGVFFVFSSTDPDSIKFAAVLDDFATKHSLTVKGVSIDGKPITTWNRPWTKANENTLEKLKLNSDYTPAIVLFDNQTFDVTPIGFGIIPHDDLANRLYVLTQLKVGEDY